jgi:diaminohydroxyphosphoribosylaminopyrimidine deaminase/5-amino-6-(5-phosphoribosylamino)uracil reductase
MALESDTKWMRLALRQAARAVGRTSPNPAVGCVLVKNGKLIAAGFTQPPGHDHAEVNALKKAASKARGATAYVTLEPCNHVGRTGKCTDALIAAGVARVVVGMRDPNPNVAGGGLKRLREKRVATEIGILEAECQAHLEKWTRWVTTGRPWVTMKAAITLDGRLAARSGDSKWVSSELSRKHAHQMRSLADAVLVGARTVAMDDPQLTARIPRGRDPRRVILDGRLSIPARSKALPGALVISALDARPRDDLAIEGVEIVQVPGRNGKVEMTEMLNALGRRGITWLLVEGGGQVHGQLLQAGLVDDVVLYIAPKLVGAGGVPLLGVEGVETMAEAWRLEHLAMKRLGEDLLVTGRVAREARAKAAAKPTAKKG